MSDCEANDPEFSTIGLVGIELTVALAVDALENDFCRYVTGVPDPEIAEEADLTYQQTESALDRLAEKGVVSRGTLGPGSDHPRGRGVTWWYTTPFVRFIDRTSTDESWEHEVVR